MKAYLYKTTKNGEIIRQGLLDSCVDIFIDKVTDIDTESDRCIWDIQEFLDKNHKEDNYVFKYKKVDIDDSMLDDGSQKRD